MQTEEEGRKRKREEGKRVGEKRRAHSFIPPPLIYSSGNDPRPLGRGFTNIGRTNPCPDDCHGATQLGLGVLVEPAWDTAGVQSGK